MLKVEDLHIEIEDSLIPETVVYDFDLSVSPGEIVGIVGESGSGKSMSALAIAGLLSRKDMKKQGSILFEGKELLSVLPWELLQTVCSRPQQSVPSDRSEIPPVLSRSPSSPHATRGTC